ncbi:nonsense-mediated mRNA decay factor SMG9 isoform X2 [Bicyclus anynana]|uniref:Nonsense-mediated mRNA decay factor SMG9 isoform X2 n=1 Tax=Bicyclus anynana TaxID=110368 RepID=A0ABM3LSY3_BICAN|nr:nonsense-mediated mRNA decay factor SMG9 isoform X2 [Bicyclus anynana]
MADKKKKLETSSVARRPVILKSDRDGPKDQSKEKNEKEKPPTIILKTREQSTPKEDRPVSPRSQSTDAEGPQPSKIAQNENKERKEQKFKLMKEPVKLLDENLEFNSAAFEFLNDSNSNYLVVGVLGTQGVGKSLVLNLIAQNISINDLHAQILNYTSESESTYESHNLTQIVSQIEELSFADAPEQKTSDKNAFKFKMEDIECIERGVHCTKGIDMYVTNDRVILLDCQALWSPSLIEETSTNPVTARSANIVTVDCLQIASYLMAVCHVLIAVQDWFADYNFIRNAFQKSNLQLNSGMYMYSDSNKNGLNIDNICKGYNVNSCGSPLNLFLLPEFYSDIDNRDIYRGHPPFDELAKRLRWMVLGVNRHQITTVPNLSEKGWFQFCSKAWETIRKCPFFIEYERFLP